MKKIIFATIFLLLFSCSNDKKENEEDGFCTEQFVIICLEVADAQGNPYVLDSIKSFINGKAIEMVTDFESEGFEWYQKYGNYPVIDDRYARRVSKHKPEYKVPESFTVVAVGYKDDKALFEKALKIQSGYCHIDCDYNPEELKVVIKE